MMMLSLDGDGGEGGLAEAAGAEDGAEFAACLCWLARRGRCRRR